MIATMSSWPGREVDDPRDVEDDCESHGDEAVDGSGRQSGEEYLEHQARFLEADSEGTSSADHVDECT